MPAMVAAAVVSNAVAGAIGGGLLGTIVGGVAGMAVSSMFADKDGGSQQPGQIDQEVRSRTVTVRQAVAPWQWIYGQCRVGGILTFAEEDAAGELHLVVTLAGHECEELGDVWFDDQVLTLDGSGNVTAPERYAGKAVVEKSRGNEAAGVQPFPNLVTASDGKWTSAHCQTGRAKLHVKLAYDPDAYPNGIPNITCVVKGRKVWDPRNSPGSTIYSTNAVLCINDYLTNAIGLGATYAEEINEVQLITAANTCDESVLKLGSPTEYENRYTCNGAFMVNDSPRSIVARLLTSCAGKLIYTAGKWGIYPAVYETPTISLDEDDLRGPIKIQPRLSKRELANAIKGVYVSPANNYQPADFPALISSTYYAEDGNERIWRELDMPFTNSASTAQRIAKIELQRNRRQITVEWPGQLGCYRLQPGNTVMITNSRFGWTDKVFEVVSSSLVLDGAVLGCNLSLRETDSNVYAWTAATDEQIVTAAPTTNLPDPFANATPTLGTPSSGTAELFVAGDGTVFSRIACALTAPSNPYIVGYEAQFARASGSPQVWQDAPPLARGAQIAYFYPVEDGVAYDVRVRAETALGNKGPWAYQRGHTVVGKTAPPSDLTSFSVAQNGALVVFAASNVTDADLDLIEVRYAEVGLGWDDATQVGNILRGQEMTTASVPPGAWEFYAKSKDTTGNYSTNAISQTLTVTNQQTEITSKNYAPDWNGVRSNVVAHWTGTLTLASQSLASALGWEVFDQFVPNPYSTGYFEAPEIDKSIDTAARIWGDAASVLGPGVSTGMATTSTEIDTKISAGAYDGFEVWTIGTRSFRYAKSRLYLDSSVGNVAVTSFTVTIDAPERTERAQGVAVAAGGTAITYSQPFHNTPNLQVTNVGTPARVTGHSGNSTTGATLRTFDPTTGSGASGTVDYNATGV